MMNWSQIRNKLKEQNPDQLIELIKGLYNLSPANKAYIRKRFNESPQDPAFLEKCRKQIINAIYPPWRNFPNLLISRSSQSGQCLQKGDR